MRFITLSLFATLLSAPAFAADLGTYRPGTPYSSTVAGGADVCDSHCAGDAQCRGWNYVKPNPRAAGICEFLSSVSTPIASQISISGVSQSAASFSPRVTAGKTNTVRVGTQVAPQPNTVRVGQATPRRNVVRRAQPERIVPQKASTPRVEKRSVENLSLTEQQNRYRRGEGAVAPRATQPQQNQLRAPQQQASVQPQRQIFRPLLDGAMPQNTAQKQRQPQVQPRQPQVQPVQRQASRRVTGPRNAPNRANSVPQGQGQAVPQFQDPRAQGRNVQGQPYQGQPYPPQQFQAPQGRPYPPQPFQAPQGQPPQGQPPQAQTPQYTQQQAALRGAARPPVGQPIQAPQQPVRPQATTPSQRLAQMTAQTRAQASAAPVTGPVALNPEQARQSLFGKLNDDLKSPAIPTASAVPTKPVTEQPLDEILAGGL